MEENLNLQDEQNLVWLDLEMTGLDPEIHTILEVACIVSDKDLNILEEGPSMAIHQTTKALNTMDEWNIETHTASGLIARVKNSKIKLADADRILVEFVSKYVPEKKGVLCGNSIHQDKRFIYKYLPKLADYLHYRMIDVSSISELYKRWYPNELPFEKNATHLAYDDIKESIDQLKYYKETIFRNLPQSTDN